MSKHQRSNECIIHAEIEYLKSDNTKIHSDICPPNCSSKHLNDMKYKKFLHTCLDEWLDKSNGTGGFYVKEQSHQF